MARSGICWSLRPALRISSLDCGTLLRSSSSWYSTSGSASSGWLQRQAAQGRRLAGLGRRWAHSGQVPLLAQRLLAMHAAHRAQALQAPTRPTAAGARPAGASAGPCAATAAGGPGRLRRPRSTAARTRTAPAWCASPARWRPGRMCPGRLRDCRDAAAPSLAAAARQDPPPGSRCCRRVVPSATRRPAPAWAPRSLHHLASPWAPAAARPGRAAQLAAATGCLPAAGGCAPEQPRR
jgi:hypothetical protein